VIEHHKGRRSVHVDVNTIHRAGHGVRTDGARVQKGVV
jgi:hypothetical protein